MTCDARALAACTRRMLAALLAALALAGCAPRPLTRADVDGKVVCDSDRMAEVERKLRGSNHQLMWVRCPTATLRAL
jgi:hypothetical protein